MSNLKKDFAKLDGKSVNRYKSNKFKEKRRKKAIKISLITLVVVVVCIVFKLWG